MAVYRQLLNTFSLSDVDEIVVNGTIDFSEATLVGFPVDNLTIRVNDSGYIEVLNGSITIAKISGTDLWARLLSDETNIATALSRTQYLSAAVNVSTFTGSIAVPAITLNGNSLETRLVSIESVNTTQDTRLSSIEGVNTVQDGRLTSIEAVDTTQNLRLSAVEGVNVTQNSRLTAIESVNTTQDTRLDIVEGTNILQNTFIATLQAQTQYQSATGNVTTFTGTIAVPAITLNGVSLNTRLTNIETDNFNQQTQINTNSSAITTLQDKTQYQSAAANVTTFSGTIAVTFITLAGASLGNALTTLQSKTSRLQVGGSGSSATSYFDSHVVPFAVNWDLGTSFENWRTLYVQSITLNGTDLNTRVSAIESNVTTLQNRTQYLTAASNISTFTGTIAVPAITLNGVSLNTRITNIESDNTTQNTNITTLQNKTQYQSATGNVTTFTGSISVPTLSQASGTLTIGSLTSGRKVVLNHGTGAADCLALPQTAKNKKLAIYESQANEHEFYGFGINGGSLRFQVDQASSTFDFFSAINSSSSTQVAKIGSASYFNGTLYTTGRGCFGGTDVKSAALSVLGGPNDGAGDATTLRLAASGSNGCKLTLAADSGGTAVLNMRVSGEFILGSTATAYTLRLSPTGIYVFGGSYTEKPTGTVWSNPSDKRIKKNIRRNNLPGLKEINKLSLISYEFNEDAEERDDYEHLGFVADEVSEIFPRACKNVPHKKFGEIKSLNISDLIYAVFPAIQELSAKLNNALKRIDELEEILGDEQLSKRRAI